MSNSSNDQNTPRAASPERQVPWLAVDAGNSRIKLALCRAGRLEAGAACAWPDPPAGLSESLCSVLDRRVAVSGCLVASVVASERETDLADTLAARLETEVTFARVDEALFPTRYLDPTRLGVDRWLAALAASASGDGACAVVDCGTALTIDLVDARGVHEGGVIAPGAATMAQALSTSTARLPLVAATAPASPGRSTDECIALGCDLAVAGLIAEAVARFDPERRRRWLVTGGAAPRLLDTPAGIPPLEHRPHLVLEGLAEYAVRAGWPAWS